MGKGLQRAFAAARRTNKFNAVKVELEGHVFDSKAEARRYSELKLLEKAGEISGLMVHPRFAVAINGVLVATYTADFSYLDRLGQGHVEDVKSAPTAAKRDFILIKKLMKAIHGIDVEIIGARSRSRPANMRAA